MINDEILLIKSYKYLISLNNIQKVYNLRIIIICF